MNNSNDDIEYHQYNDVMLKKDQILNWYKHVIPIEIKYNNL